MSNVTEARGQAQVLAGTPSASERRSPTLGARGDTGSLMDGLCNLVLAASSLDGDAPAEDEVRN